MDKLFAEIARVTPEGGDWCSVEKAQTLAAIIVASRPRCVVEIGVWMGGSLIPMLMALKHVGTGVALGIDAWSTSASADGQVGDDEAWWKGVDHDAAYRAFMQRVQRHELGEFCRVVRASSSDVDPNTVVTHAVFQCAPSSEEHGRRIGIDLLHVDGNHGPQALSDVVRFAPLVPVGGYLVLDDVHWTGGNVTRAVEAARQLGFVECYPLGTGLVMQRVL